MIRSGYNDQSQYKCWKLFRATLTSRISLASLHCTFNFLTCAFNRWSSSLWSSWAQLTQYTPANITSERLPTGMGSGDRPFSRQYRCHLSNMADRQSSSSSTQPVPAVSLSEVNIINLMFLRVLNVVLNDRSFLLKPF